MTNTFSSVRPVAVLMPRPVAIDLNPLHWLGDAASAAAGDVWQSAMTGLWSAALWLIKLAFTIIDQFTTPDLSGAGPLRGILPTTLWLGATVAVLMCFVQLTVALVRRDGQSMGRVLLGVGQFGLVWAGYLGIAAGLVAAAGGLSRGILSATLHVQVFHDFDFNRHWPASVDDITLATVLGVLSLLLVIPSAFFYVVIMLVREAALIILVATAPISAGGLLSEVGKSWFWKTLRWFFACLLISPCAALLLGTGVQLTDGAINQPAPPSCLPHCSSDWVLAHAAELARYTEASNAAHAGMAIIGCIVIAIGACCPLMLFRLLAFVEPGTASGAALRQSWGDAGGLAGVLSGGHPHGRAATGNGAALGRGVDGRAAGEGGAEAATSSRLTAALSAAGAVGAVGAGIRVASTVAHRMADLGADVLGQAGIGSPGYSLTPTDERTRRPTANNASSRVGAGDPGADAPTSTPAPAAPEPYTP
ncbi:MAG: type IV secretion system protein, partial [Jatrophihabitans sp.]|uniref:type IV secretion system protein n=1 Tax=Jatrophihabitans sp. TaxID=1932789 RepID=UPI003F8237D9